MTAAEGVRECANAPLRRVLQHLDEKREPQEAMFKAILSASKDPNQGLDPRTFICILVSKEFLYHLKEPNRGSGGRLQMVAMLVLPL
ncbi:hypothetical protein CEXT_595721 [Caerostris extrusa]|uniref:Uncharacterized protein n=1 Tax=Caerostris extrusa TaxID=172846 RepID=A0AAV4Y2E3_CAEEX|nr:hypothetical protein CEXT_595721 [Caerostris extrusa]